MKPHIRLHVWASGRYCAEVQLPWTPSYLGAAGTAREALASLQKVWPYVVKYNAKRTTHNQR